MNEENEVMEEKKSGEMMVKDLGSMGTRRKSNVDIYTNITDNKKIFNLETKCDFRINECKGEMIRVKEVLIKVIEKMLDKPEINEETGEIVKDREFKKICILIDDNNKSYVTASKMFTNQMMQYIQMFGYEELENEGLVIRISERAMTNSSNKALAFELV